MNRSPRIAPLDFVLSAAVTVPAAFAVDDAAPVNAKEMLQTLKTLKDQQSTTSKTAKQRFITEANAAASNPARAVELWEEAVRATQFQGVAKENAQFKDWKEKEGEALKEREVQNALRLYFNWLSLTLQRSAGAETKAILPAVISHAREVLADQAAMDAFADNIKREKEALSPQPGGARKMVNPRDKQKPQNDAAVKRMHDEILNRPLASSVFVQWMKLGDYITDVAPQKKGKGGKGNKGATADTNEEPAPPTWEGTPGNSDGIYQTIVLPAFREAKDPRVVEYWDALMKREADNATRSKLTFEAEKFNTVRRPQLQWSKCQDLAVIGQKNRAMTDMYTLIKTYPNHPDAKAWITELEGMLVPPAPAGSSLSTTTGAPATTQ